MNPVLDSVRTAFDRVVVHPQRIAIDRKGVALPAGGHFQGIQRLGAARHRLFVTSSSDSQAYLVVCDMTADGTGGRANPPVTLARSPLNHAGGFQIAGDVLAVGVENFNSQSASQVQFWNVAGSPAQLPGLTVGRSGARYVSTAGAVGVTSYRGGALLAVATWDAGTVDFYTAAADPFRSSGAKFQPLRTWVASLADKTGWIDRNFGAYQSVNLIAQRDGALYMVAFHNSSGEDWMDLFAIVPDAPALGMLKKVAKKHMYCTDGCSFEFGSGIWVPSTSRFEVYAVKGDSGDHQTGTTIEANHFPAA